MKHAVYSNSVFIILIVLGNMLLSCRPDTVCRENTKTRLICEFRRVYLDEGRQPQIDPIWDSITVVGIGATDLLYNNSKGLVQLALPLHIAADSTMFALTYHNQVDTLYIRHTNQPEFISMECGCVVSHIIQTVYHTHHWIDSVTILNSPVTREGSANIELWRNETPL